MEIINKRIDELKQYDNNPRRNDNSVEYVANSIREFGFRVPILIDKDNVIISGHTRHKAAMQLGLTEVPCIVADDMTEEQIKAFRIADNKAGESSEWNFFKLSAEMAELDSIDMTDFGFDESELESIMGLANDLKANTDRYFHDDDDEEETPVVRTGVYTPTYEPQVGTEIVTNDDIAKAKMEERSLAQSTIKKVYKTMICPHCGKEFTYDD